VFVTGCHAVSRVNLKRTVPTNYRKNPQHMRPGQLSRFGDSLRDGRSGDRVAVEARFSALVQTGPAAHPASYTMGTGSFPGVKRLGRGIDHPPPSSAEVKERV